MSLLIGLILVCVVLIVIAYSFPVLWPIVTTAGANITGMSGSDAGTTTMQAFWPVVLLMVGLGIAVGLVLFALKKFGLFAGRG